MERDLGQGAVLICSDLSPIKSPQGHFFLKPKLGGWEKTPCGCEFQHTLMNLPELAENIPCEGAFHISGLSFDCPFMGVNSRLCWGEQ